MPLNTFFKSEIRGSSTELLVPNVSGIRKKGVKKHGSTGDVHQDKLLLKWLSRRGRIFV